MDEDTLNALEIEKSFLELDWGQIIPHYKATFCKCNFPEELKKINTEQHMFSLQKHVFQIYLIQ